MNLLSCPQGRRYRAVSRLNWGNDCEETPVRGMCHAPNYRCNSTLRQGLQFPLWAKRKTLTLALLFSFTIHTILGGSCYSKPHLLKSSHLNQQRCVDPKTKTTGETIVSINTTLNDELRGGIENSTLAIQTI